MFVSCLLALLVALLTLSVQLVWPERDVRYDFLVEADVAKDSMRLYGAVLLERVDGNAEVNRGVDLGLVESCGESTMLDHLLQYRDPHL